MRLSRDNYKTNWDIHAWAGVIIGLFVAVMFGTGAIVVFHDQIQTWQDPYAQKPTPEASYDRLMGLVTASFDGDPPARFGLRMPTGERGYPRLSYFSTETGRYTEDWIDPKAGQVVDKPDKLATLLYHMHTLYDARFPYPYYLAGIISMVMLLVVATGFAIQWHNLVDQFHQFRAEADPFVRWNDLHKVVGVASLPFQLFYAYSAVIIILGSFFVNAATGPVFGGDAEAARSATFGTLSGPPSPGDRATPASLDRLVATAREAVPGLEVRKVTLHNWGHENGVVDVQGGVDGERFSRARVRVGQVDGGVRAVSAPTDQSWAAEIRRWLIETHGVKMGGVGTQLLFALLSFACAASMLAGMAVWLARRRRRRDALIDRVLETLTAGVGTATLVAAAAVFFASRGLPWEMADRWRFQEWTYYITWLTCVAGAFSVSDVTRYWRIQLTLAGLLFVGTPVLAARLSSAGLAGIWVDQPPVIWSVLGVDVGLLVGGLGLLATAHWLGDGRRG